MYFLVTFATYDLNTRGIADECSYIDGYCTFSPVPCMLNVNQSLSCEGPDFERHQKIRVLQCLVDHLSSGFESAHFD